MIREAHGLEPLVAIIKDKSVRDNKQLLAAVTGAIWKCAASDENVKQLDNVSLPFFHIIYYVFSLFFTFVPATNN